ncbi:hypothetical protein Tco_1115854 [Tanacetum coccineum]
MANGRIPCRIAGVSLLTLLREEDSFNLLKIGDDLFSYESPACLLFEQNTRFYDDESIDTLDSSDNVEEPEAEHENVKQIPNLGKIVSRWHVCKPVRIFYDNECGKDYGMWPTCNPDLSFCSGYDAIYGKGENGMLEQWMCFRDHKRQGVDGNRMIFTDFLKDSEFNDNDISHEAKMYGNPCKYHHEYPRSYFPQKDKGMPKPWRSSFNEEYTKNMTPIDKLANEYDLRKGKKGYALDDVWEKCKKIHSGTLYPWHDKGFKEEERWESGIEKTNYELPFVDIETFEIKRYSFEGRSFVCITKQLDDALPLGRANGSRFMGMIRKEMDEEGGAQRKT